MPGMGATDPADLMAQARREAGLTRQLQQQRRVPPHPSRGGARGFPEWYRDEQLQRHQNHELVMSPPRPSPAGTDDEIAIAVRAIVIVHNLLGLI